MEYSKLDLKRMQRKLKKLQDKRNRYNKVCNMLGASSMGCVAGLAISLSTCLRGLYEPKDALLTGATCVIVGVVSFLNYANIYVERDKMDNRIMKLENECYPEIDETEYYKLYR